MGAPSSLGLGRRGLVCEAPTVCTPFHGDGAQGEAGSTPAKGGNSAVIPKILAVVLELDPRFLPPEIRTCSQVKLSGQPRAKMCFELAE